MTSRRIKIGLIGDRNPALRSHTATEAALDHTAGALSLSHEVEWLTTTGLTHDLSPLTSCDALWCAPGTIQNRDGALNAIRYARENDIPYLGTCGGFQNTLLEYARNVLNMADAEHEETSPDSSTLFITKLACSLVGSTQHVKLAPGTFAQSVYGADEVMEEFNCNYGLNPNFRETLEQSALAISGVDNNNEARIVELRPNRFFMATLFLPQLSSTPGQPHPLVAAFIRAAL